MESDPIAPHRSRASGSRSTIGAMYAPRLLLAAVAHYRGSESA